MNIALILSGGTGSRTGLDVPKQYVEVCGMPIISYCMKTLSGHDGIDAIQIVAEEEWQELISKSMEQMEKAKEPGITEKFKGFSKPGANRQLSILSGLKDIRKYTDDLSYVLIHDAARPMLSTRLISDCLDAVAGHEGVIPVLPMKDTVYSSEDGRTITSLLNRSQIFAGQAPELFILGKYYEANATLTSESILQINGSTEPAIIAGMDIAMIPGDERNFKITTLADLRRFEQIQGGQYESMGTTWNR